MSVQKMMASGLPAGTAKAIGGDVATLAAAGTTATDAAAIISDNVTLTGASNAGVKLPSAVIGEVVCGIVTGANTIKVYPPTGGTLNGGSVDAAVSVATLKPFFAKATSNLNYLVVVGA